MASLDSSTTVDPVLQSFPKARPKHRTRTVMESYIGFRREYVARKDSSIAGVYKRIASLKENKTKWKKERMGRKNSVSQHQVQAQSMDEFPHSNENENALNPVEMKSCAESCGKDPESKSVDGLTLRSSNGSFCTSSVPFAAENTLQYSNGRMSSHAVTRADALSFEFFVASENGVNLLVDLGSKPFDWIRSLKNEIGMSEILAPDIRGLGSGKKASNKPPAELLQTNSQGNGSSGSIRCVSCESAPDSLDHGTQSCERNMGKGQGYDAGVPLVPEMTSACQQDTVEDSLHPLFASTSEESCFSLPVKDAISQGLTSNT